MRPQCIVFSGVGKTEAEMALALEGGLFQFNIESIEEAEMLSAVAASMGKIAAAAFRVNPNVGGGAHAKITTGSAENKFGIPIADAPAFYTRASLLPALKLQGVAVHIGSQLSSLDRDLPESHQHRRPARFRGRRGELGGGSGSRG